MNDRFYTLICITQVIEHGTIPIEHQRIVSSEQSQINCEHLIKAQDLQSVVQGKIRELHFKLTKTLPPIPPFTLA